MESVGGYFPVLIISAFDGNIDIFNKNDYNKTQ